MYSAKERSVISIASLTKIPYSDLDFYYNEVMMKSPANPNRARSDGHARVDRSQIHLNKTLMEHPTMHPDVFWPTCKRKKASIAEAVAEYHAQVSGKRPRLNGNTKQLSKAIGFVCTLPKEYVLDKYQHLTDEEIDNLVACINGGKKISENLSAKLTEVKWSEKECNELISDFFEPVLEVFLEVASIRKEDVLYAVVHFHETFPHIHTVALSSVTTLYKEDVFSKQSGKVIHKKGEVRHSFSTERFVKSTKAGKDFFGTFHEKLVTGLKARNVKCAEYLYTGITREIGAFDPNVCTREQRDDAVVSARVLSELNRKINSNEEFIHELEKKKQELIAVNKELEKKKTVLQNEIGAIIETAEKETKSEIMQRVSLVFNGLYEEIEEANSIEDAKFVIRQKKIVAEDVVKEAFEFGSYRKTIKRKIKVLDDEESAVDDEKRGKEVQPPCCLFEQGTTHIPDKKVKRDEDLPTKNQEEEYCERD